MRFLKLENLLYAVGAMMIFSSAFLLSKSDRLGAWLGIVSEKSYREVARIEKVQNSANRKQIDDASFSPVVSDEPLFNHDTIMTGPDSSLVIALPDGGLVQLDADTLIQIETKDEDSLLTKSDLVFEVQKGHISGISGEKSLGLEPPKATPAPTVKPVKTAGIQDIPRFCQITSQDLQPPTEATQFLPKLSLLITCNTLTPTLVIIQKEGEPKPKLFANLPATNGALKAEYLIPSPGRYALKFDLKNSPPVFITVPQVFVGLQWEDPLPRCDRGVGWKNIAANNAIRWELLASTGGGMGRIIRQQPAPGKNNFSDLKELTLPTTLKVQLHLKNGYTLQTSAYALQAWKVCPTLKLPKDGTVIPFNPNSDIYLTWNYLNGHDVFILEVANDAAFQHMVYTEKLSQNFKLVGLGKKGTYYWRIKEVNSATQSDSFHLIVQ